VSPPCETPISPSANPGQKPAKTFSQGSPPLDWFGPVYSVLIVKKNVWSKYRAVKWTSSISIRHYNDERKLVRTTHPRIRCGNEDCPHHRNTSAKPLSPHLVPSLGALALRCQAPRLMAAPGMAASPSINDPELLELRAIPELRIFVSVLSIRAGHVSDLSHSERRAKYKWLPNCSRGKKIGCFGLTEPTFGSNPGGMLHIPSRSVQKGNTSVLTGENLDTRRLHRRRGSRPGPMRRRQNSRISRGKRGTPAASRPGLPRQFVAAGSVTAGLHSATRNSQDNCSPWCRAG